MKLFDNVGNYTHKAQTKIIGKLDKAIVKEIKKMKNRHRLKDTQVECIALDVLGFRAKFPLNE